MKSEYTTKPYSMISGQGEAQSRKYHKYIGKSGRTWLVADQEAAGENVYISGDKNSDGFGGATLVFPLVDGTEISLKGPWHTHSEALFQDTGIDVRDKHRSFCVIACGRTGFSPTTFTDVLYIDDKPTIGHFDRLEIKQMAQEFADTLGHTVYFYKETYGGSSSTPIDPTGKRHTPKI